MTNCTSQFSIGPGANEISALGVNEDPAENQIARIYEASLEGIADMFGQ